MKKPTTNTLTSATIRPLLRLLRQHNVELEPVLKAAEVEISLPRIEVSEFDLLVQKASDFLKAPNMGLLLGQEFRFSDFPLLPFLLNSCESGRDLLMLLRRYYSLLISDSDVPDIFIGPDSTKIVFYVSQGTGFAMAQRTFLMLAGLHNAGQTLGQRLYHLMEVGVRQPESSSTLGLAEYLNVPVRYNQSHNWISISSKFLDRILAQASPVLMGEIQQWVQRAAQEYAHLPIFSQQVSYVLWHWPKAVGMTKESVAELLSISSRTLTRRLQEEGHPFSELLKDARLRRAQEALLLPKANVQHIAAELGFSDRRGFERAFKQWTGSTPAAFKRAHKNQQQQT